MRTVWWSWLVAGAVALAGAGAPASARDRGAEDPRALSAVPLEEDGGWRRYLLDDGDGLVYPTGVAVEGDRAAVEDPDGLKAPGGGATTIRATGAGAPRLVLDLGLNTGGTVEVGFTRTDGTDVRLAYSEARRFLTPQGDTTSSSLGDDEDPDSRSDVVDTAGRREWRSPTRRGAQRWVLLQLEGPGAVSIDYVRVRVEHYRPGPADYVGRFLSDDDQVNRTWYASAYTFNLDAFRDERAGGKLVVTDGAKRDRLVWLGDLAIENLLGAYSTRGAPSIVRDSIEMFACQQFPDGYLPMYSELRVRCDGDPGPADGPPESAAEEGRSNGVLRLPEYTGWWIVALAEYTQLTGDRTFARRMLPVAQRGLDYFRANLRDGLFFTPPNSINWHPFDVAEGRDTHTNAVWFRALRSVADLERLVGDPGRAPGLEAEARRLGEAINAILWDEQAGAYLLNADNPRRNHGQDGNVEAVLAGVATGERARRALRFVRERLASRFGPLTGEYADDPYMSQYISPFISSDELLARFGSGDGEGAMDLLRRLYGHMVDTDPNVTMWEKLGADGDAASYSPNQLGKGLIPSQASAAGPGLTSLAHGWSGGPAPALSAYVAGLRPAAPGWERWLVAPQPVDLRFVQAQAGTPQGALAARWRRGSGDRTFTLTVDGPGEVEGEVHVPLLGRERTIARDGRIVWRDGRPVGGVRAQRRGDVVAFAGQRGDHTFAWGPLVRACTSRRSILITVRRRPRRAARVLVGGRPVARLRRGQRRVRVDLRGRPGGAVRVRIAEGRRVLDERRYRLCVRR